MNKFEKFDKTQNSIHFDSILEIMEFEKYEGWPEANQRNFERHQKENLGTNSVPTAPLAKQCIEYALVGDRQLFETHGQKMISDLKKYADDVFETDQNRLQKKRKRTKSNFGNELDIHKVYSGQLDRAWDATKIVQVNESLKFVTIVCDILQNWNVPALPSLWSMAVICTLADYIESCGKNVEIIVGGAGRGTNYNKQYTTISVCVKKYNERLAIERLCAMSHLGFARSFLFMGFDTSQFKNCSSLGGNRGFNQTLPLQLKEQIDAGHTRALVIDCCLSEADARKALIKANREFLLMMDGL